MGLIDIKWYKSFAACGIFGLGMWGLRASIPEDPIITSCEKSGIVGIEPIDAKMEADIKAMDSGTIPKVNDETSYTFTNPANGETISFTLKERRVCDKAVAQHEESNRLKESLSWSLIAPIAVSAQLGLMNLLCGPSTPPAQSKTPAAHQDQPTLR